MTAPSVDLCSLRAVAGRGCTCSFVCHGPEPEQHPLPEDGAVCVSSSTLNAPMVSIAHGHCSRRKQRVCPSLCLRWIFDSIPSCDCQVRGNKPGKVCCEGTLRGPSPARDCISSAHMSVDGQRVCREGCCVFALGALSAKTHGGVCV